MHLRHYFSHAWTSYTVNSANEGWKPLVGQILHVIFLVPRALLQETGSKMRLKHYVGGLLRPARLRKESVNAHETPGAPASTTIPS